MHTPNLPASLAHPLDLPLQFIPFGAAFPPDHPQKVDQRFHMGAEDYYGSLAEVGHAWRRRAGALMRPSWQGLGGQGSAAGFGGSMAVGVTRTHAHPPFHLHPHATVL